VRRWYRLRDPGWRLSIVINSIGALVTGVVLIVVAATKFALGAWIVLLVLPFLVLLLYLVHRHYSDVHDALVLPTLEFKLSPPVTPVVIVPIARLDRSAVQALSFARSISSSVKAVHISTTREGAEEFRRRWSRWDPDVALDVIESPYRSLLTPLLHYIDAIDRADSQPITVVLAEFVPRHWWEFLLHSQTAFRLKAALLFRRNTIVIDVPYHFEDVARIS